MKVDFILENKISQTECEQIVYKWLSEGEYTPDDITQNIIGECKFLYLPFYYFRHDYSGVCSATLGFSKAVPYTYYDNDKKHQVTGYNYVIESQAYNQPIFGSVSTIVYAGSPLPVPTFFFEDIYLRTTELHELPSNLIGKTELNKLFQFSKIDSWILSGKQKADSKISLEKRQGLPSTLVDRFSVEIEKYSEIKSLGFIASYWIYFYEYGGKKYYVIVDGNNPTRITGTKPVDEKRKDTVKSLRWLGWSAGILSIILTLYLLAGQDFSEIEFTLTNAGVAIGGIILTWLAVKAGVSQVKQSSIDSRKQLLGHKLNQLELKEK